MSKRVSMRDIATEAGVSVMAVSLALRGSSRVSEATRKRIQAIAEEKGFAPDPALRALVAYRAGKQFQGFSGVVAYINNTCYPSAVKVLENHGKFFSGAVKGGKSLGYKVEEFWLKEPGLTPKRAASILQSRGIQGLILGPPETAGTIMEFEWAPFSVVSFGFSLKSPRFNTVANETFNSMLLCMQELGKLGYCRPGLIILEDQDNRTQHRYSGAYHVGWEYLSGRSETLPILRSSKLNREEFNEWFKTCRPDVVIGPCRQALQFMMDLGVNVPDEVGFVSPFGTLDVQDCAHADARTFDVGRAAISLVSSMIDQNDRGIPDLPRTVNINPVWVPNSTVRAVGEPIIF
jgi:DNA-binding LacI/PurR family transcriptional regulator